MASNDNPFLNGTQGTSSFVPTLSSGNPFVTGTARTATSATDRALAETRQKQREEAEQRKIFSGGIYSDIGDILSVGQYASAGAARDLLGKEPERGFLSSIAEGVRQRESYIDIVQESFPYTASEEWTKNIVPELWRTGLGLAGDIVLDPLTYAGGVGLAGKVGKGLGIVSKAAKGGKAASVASKFPRVTKASKATRDVLGKALVYRYGQPKEYKELAQKALVEIGLGKQKAEDIGKAIADLSPAQQKRVSQIMRGGITTNASLRAIADPAIQEFKALGSELVDLGLLKASTFEKYAGKYLPRLYTKHELPDGLAKIFRDSKPMRADLSRLKQRKDIPEDVRKAMGEILEAGYPTAKGIAQLRQTVGMTRMFEGVAKSFGKELAQDGYRQLPDTKTLGKLAGKYVPDAIYDDIQRMTKQLSPAQKLYKTGLGAWKYSKVILNPSTWSRNFVSNMIQNDLGGLSPFRVDIYREAITQIMGEGKMFKEAKKLGLGLDTYYKAELGDFLKAYDSTKGRNAVYKLYQALKSAGGKLGDGYQGIEQLFKMAHYIYKRRGGATAKEAFDSAQKYLFDYQALPPFIKALRDAPIGYPFITFMYKALPIFAETAIRDPGRIAKYYKGMRAVESFNPFLETQEEIETEKEARPEWMQGGAFLRLPFKDKYGRSLYLDLNYILPWGDIGELGTTLAPNNPLYVVTADLIRNKSAFTKREIVPPGATDAEATEKVTEYVIRALAPSLFPKGYSYNKLKEAILKTPDYKDRVRDLKQVIFDVFFGLKTQPIDTYDEMHWRNYERQQAIEEVQARMRSLQRNKALSPENRNKLLQDYREKIKRLQTVK